MKVTRGGGGVRGEVPVILAHDATQDAEGDGDQGPDDQDHHNGSKGQSLCGLQQQQQGSSGPYWQILR